MLGQFQVRTVPEKLYYFNATDVVLRLRRDQFINFRFSYHQRQKFRTDDANQCLPNKSGSYGVPNINLSNFT